LLVCYITYFYYILPSATYEKVHRLFEIKDLSSHNEGVISVPTGRFPRGVR